MASYDGSDSDSDHPTISASELLLLERQLDAELDDDNDDGAVLNNTDDEDDEYYKDRKSNSLFGLTDVSVAAVKPAPLPTPSSSSDSSSSISSSSSPFDLSSLPGFSEFLRSSTDQSASLSALSLSASSALALVVSAAETSAQSQRTRRQKRDDYLRLETFPAAAKTRQQDETADNAQQHEADDGPDDDSSSSSSSSSISSSPPPEIIMSLPSSSEIFALALTAAVRACVSDVITSVELAIGSALNQSIRQAHLSISAVSARRDERISADRERQLARIDALSTVNEDRKARLQAELCKAKSEADKRLSRSIKACLKGVDVTTVEKELGRDTLLRRRDDTTTSDAYDDDKNALTEQQSSSFPSAEQAFPSILPSSLSSSSVVAPTSPSGGGSDDEDSDDYSSAASAALSRARAVRTAALASVSASLLLDSSSRNRCAIFLQSRLRGLRARKETVKRRRTKRLCASTRAGGGGVLNDDGVPQPGLAYVVFRVACVASTRVCFIAWRDAAVELRRRENEAKAEKEANEKEAERKAEEERRRRIKLEQQEAERSAKEDEERKSREEEARRLEEEDEKRKRAEEELATVREEARRRHETQLALEREAEEIRKAEAQARAELAVAELRRAAEDLDRERGRAAAERKAAEGAVNATLFEGGGTEPRRLTTLPPPSASERARALSKAVSAMLRSDASSTRSNNTKFSKTSTPTPPAQPRSRQPSISSPSEGVLIDEDMLSGVGALDKLTSLSLNVEQLTDASYLAMKGCTSLTSLSLNVNNLTSLQTLSGLKSLERLSVKDNKISSLDGMKPLQGLVELQCDVNNLTSLQTLTQGSWFNLTSFSANTNSISALPSALSPHLPGLSMLSLYQNKISHIPENAFCSLPTLTSVDLGRNLLKDAASLAAALNKAPTMRRLVLSQNELREVPLLGLPLLRQLWLSGNELESLDGWSFSTGAHLPCLEELYLQENRIVNLGGAGALGLCCPILSKLDLSFNRIATVEDLVVGVAQCDYLKTLDMQDNPVKTSRAVEIRLLQVAPMLALLNGETLKPEIKWLAFSAPVSMNATIANFAVRSCLQNCTVLPFLAAADKSVCDAAIAAWVKYQAGEEKGFACANCGHNQFRENSTSCARCGAVAPPKPVDPLLLDWRLLLPFGVVPSNSASSSRQLQATAYRAAFCRAINVSGMESHSRWKRGFASESSRSRSEANEKHAEVLRSQLLSVEAGSEEQHATWSIKKVEGNGWDTRHVVASSSKQGVARPSSAGRRRGSKAGTVGGLRMANSAIEGAAVMRVQCCVRRFMACRKFVAVRRIAKKIASAGTIQALWRGGIIRSRVQQLKSMKFDYIDPEIAEMERMLGEETGSGGGLNLGHVDLDDDMDGGGWVPKKPVEPVRSGVAPAAMGWGTPDAGASKRGAAMPAGSAATAAAMQTSREISSPFDGRRQAPTRGETTEAPIDSATVENLRRGGFDFNPGNKSWSTQNDDDMEVRSVSTAQLEEGGNGGGLTERSSGFMKTGSSSSDKNRRREEDLMKDWGISDPKIVQNMMKRQNRLNKPKVDKAKADKMKDPQYRYEKLQKVLGKTTGSRVGDIDR